MENFADFAKISHLGLVPMKRPFPMPLICVLALLQLAAPLVHAHSGKDHAVTGFHVPGLEFISSRNDSTAANAAAIQTATDGIIIGVGSGIERTDFFLDSPTKHWIHAESTVPDDAGVLGVAWSLRVVPFTSPNFLSVPFARAPPSRG